LLKKIQSIGSFSASPKYRRKSTLLPYCKIAILNFTE
jgi:hypothetical protein